MRVWNTVLPPVGFPPELLVGVEVEDPDKLLKSLSAGGGAVKVDSHRGHDIYRVGEITTDAITDNTEFHGLPLR